MSVFVSILTQFSTFSIYPGAMPNGEYLGTLQGVFTSPYNWLGVNFPPGS